MKEASQLAGRFLEELTSRLAGPDANWSRTLHEMEVRSTQLPSWTQRRVALRLLYRLLSRREPQLSRVEREVYASLYHHLIPNVFLDPVDLMGLLGVATDDEHPDWFLLKPALFKLSRVLEQGRLSEPFCTAYRRFIIRCGNRLPKESTELMADMIRFCHSREPNLFEVWILRIEQHAIERESRLRNVDMTRTAEVLAGHVADDLRRILSLRGVVPAEDRPRLLHLAERLGTLKNKHVGLDITTEASGRADGRHGGYPPVDLFRGRRLPGPGADMDAYIQRLLALHEETSLLPLCDQLWMQRCFIKVEGLAWPAAYMQLLEVYQRSGRRADTALHLLALLIQARGTAPSGSWLVQWTVGTTSLSTEQGLNLCERLALLPGSRPDLPPDDLSVGLARGAMWGMSRWRNERTPAFLSALLKERLERDEHPMQVAAAAIKALELLGTPEALNELMQLREETPQQHVRKMISAVLSRVAASRGLDVESLQDLAVNRHGLSAGAIRQWDAGSRQVHLKLDERGQVHTVVHDVASNKAVPDNKVPEQPGLMDEVRRLAEAVTRTYNAQKRRLEAYLSTGGRTWRCAEWIDVFGNHPILANISQRVLWRIELIGPPLHLMPTGTGAFCDVTGGTIRLPPEAILSVAHPVQLPDDVRRSWRERIVASMMVQPFKQLFRETYTVLPPDTVSARASARFAGLEVSLQPLMEHLETRGWTHTGAPGRIHEVHKDFADASIRVLVTWKKAHQDTQHVVLQEIEFRRAFSAHAGARVGDPLHLGDVPPVVFSEALRDVEWALLDLTRQAPMGADRWNEKVAQDPQFWPRQRQLMVESPQARARGDLLQLLISGMQMDERVRVTGSLVTVRGDDEVYGVHLATADVYRLADGMRLEMHVPTPMLEAVYLPFEDDDPLTRLVVATTMLLQSHDMQRRGRVSL